MIDPYDDGKFHIPMRVKDQISQREVNKLHDAYDRLLLMAGMLGLGCLFSGTWIGWGGLAAALLAWLLLWLPGRDQ